MMPGMNFVRLSPGPVGNDKLNRPSVLRHEFIIQFHGMNGGVKQKSPIAIGQEIAQVERFSCVPSHPHLAVHERSQREPACVAASLQLIHVNDKTHLGF